MRGLRGLGIQGLANPVFSAGCPGGGNAVFNATLSYNPIAYWPMNELSGTAAVDYGSIGITGNGAYSGVTLDQIDAPGGGRAGLWDGNDLMSLAAGALAALNAVVNMQLITVVTWFKVSAAGDWTDGAQRHVVRMYINASNFLIARKTPTVNQYGSYYAGAGTTDQVVTTAYNNTNWNMHAITVSNAADQMITYMNGAQYGATQTGIGDFAGALGAVVIGSGAATEYWKGYIAHTAIYASILTQPQIASIYAGSI